MFVPSIIFRQLVHTSDVYTFLGNAQCVWDVKHAMREVLNKLMVLISASETEKKIISVL